MLLVFHIGPVTCGVPLERVHRVTPAAEIVSLAVPFKAILGVVNVAGEVLPVFDVGHLLGQASRSVQLTDHFVIAQCRQRTVVLLVDDTEGLRDCSEAEVVCAAEIVGDVGTVSGIAKLKDGLVLIHDLDRFLSDEENRRLTEALAQTGGEA